MVHGEDCQGGIDCLTILPATAACLVLTGCRDKPEQAGRGTFSGRRYANEFFGLSVKVPDDWFLPSVEDFDRLMAAGAKLAGKTAKATVAGDGPQDTRLFSLFRHPPESDEPDNPGLIAVAEYIGKKSTMKSGSDYLGQFIKSLRSPLEWAANGEMTTEKLGGATFSKLSGRLSNEWFCVDQTYYTAIRKGYAVCFVLSYTDSQQLTDLTEILATVKFE